MWFKTDLEWLKLLHSLLENTNIKIVKNKKNKYALRDKHKYFSISDKDWWSCSSYEDPDKYYITQKFFTTPRKLYKAYLKTIVKGEIFLAEEVNVLK